MLPPPASARSGRKICAQTNGPLRLVARIVSQSASATWSKSVGLLIPALLTRIGDRPEAARVLGRGRDACAVGHIHLQGERAPAHGFDLLDDLLRFAAVFAEGQNDVRARFGEAQSDGAPDAAAAAGDDGVLSGQRKAAHCRPLLARDGAFGGFGDERRGDAEMLGQFVRFAGRAETVVQAHEFDRTGMRLGHRFGDGAAQAAIDIVIFGGDDGAGFRRRSA